MICPICQREPWVVEFKHNLWIVCCGGERPYNHAYGWSGETKNAAIARWAVAEARL